VFSVLFLPVLKAVHDDKRIATIISICISLIVIISIPTSTYNLIISQLKIFLIFFAIILFIITLKTIYDLFHEFTTQNLAKALLLGFMCAIAVTIFLGSYSSFSTINDNATFFLSIALINFILLFAVFLLLFTKKTILLFTCFILSIISFVYFNSNLENFNYILKSALGPKYNVMMIIYRLFFGITTILFLVKFLSYLKAPKRRLKSPQRVEYTLNKRN
jgi:hypothetical protein